MSSPVCSGPVFQFGLFEADVTANMLRRDGVRVRIQDQPFRLLIHLLERPGEIVTREELHQKLWPEGTYVDFEGSLNAALRKLRVALGDDSENPSFIETVPRRGYRFIAPVSVLQNRADKPAEDVPRPTSAALSLPSSGKNRVATYVLIAASVLVVAIAGMIWRRNRSLANPLKFSLQANASLPARKSVAILGFHNTSGRPDDDWLSTAFSEMLSTELAGGEQLRLVPGEDVVHVRVTAPWPQGGSLDPVTTARLGSALNSDLLVVGSYTALGNGETGILRLDARLQEAKTGEILAETAESGKRKEMFQLVARLGMKLRDRLGLPRLAEPEQANALASLPSNSEAARFYSLGLQKLREYDTQAARNLFEQTTKSDPKFPLAYAMLSRADIWLGHDEQAKGEAKRGLELAGGLSRVQKMEVEASYYQAISDRGRAANIYKALFDLFPDNLDYGLQLSKLQLESYHPDEALETVRRLRRLRSPDSNDPSIDYREATIIFPKDIGAAENLFRSAAVKAESQGKHLAYAKAESALCRINSQRLPSPPECEEAYKIFAAAGDYDSAGNCLVLMADANRQTGHDDEAVLTYERALKIFKEAGDREKIGVALNNMTLILQNQAKFDAAEKAYREALENFRMVNDKAGQAAALSNIGDIQSLRGHVAEAADYYRQSWEVAEASQRARPEYAHVQHSALQAMKGDLASASSEVERQIGSLRKSDNGEPWVLATALQVRGDIVKAHADFNNANKDYSEAAEILKKANVPAVSQQVAMADLAIVMGHPDGAEASLRETITQLEKDRDFNDEIPAYTSLSRALLQQGKIKEAEKAITHAFTLADIHDFPVLALPLQILRARVDLQTAKPGIGGMPALKSVQTQLRALIQQAHRLGLYQIECEARLALGEVEGKTNPITARRYLADLASEAQGHGFELLARQAEAISNFQQQLASNQ